MSNIFFLSVHSGPGGGSRKKMKFLKMILNSYRINLEEISDLMQKELAQ